VEEAMTREAIAATPALQPVIQSRILALREQRVMLDADLARLYGVQTKVLVQAVKRNLARFPEDFMFQLSAAEFAHLRSQSVTSSAAGPAGAKRLAELEDKTDALVMNHDTFSRNTRAQLKQVFDALREPMTPPDPPKRPIGFVTPEDKGKKR
jgi:ORF6N domain